jgi:ketosteroid isomerase-like protein
MGKNVDILRSMLAKVQAGDYAGAEKLLHPELVVDEPESITHGGVFKGRDASRRVKEIIRATWDQQMGELQCYDCGDTVITRREITWTSRATGKSAPCTAVEFFDFRDGKIARITVYLRDTKRLMQTLEP